MRRRWISGLLASLFVLALFVAMPAQKAQAVISIEPTGETAGDVAIFPFYDVSGTDRINFFWLVNTVDYWIQVHIRFRTMECSIECLDFDVILSPHDVFTFWVLPGNPPIFFSDDVGTLEHSGLIPDTWWDPAQTRVQTTFDSQRLEDLGITGDDLQNMLERGYVVAIVEGLIEKHFWDHCGPFDSLREAARTDIADSCPWDNTTAQHGPWWTMATIAAGRGLTPPEYANLDNVGKAGVYWNGAAWVNFNATASDWREIVRGSIIYGNEYFVNTTNFSGYGVNAATIVGFRVRETCQTTGATGWTHIDDAFNHATFGAVLRSGMNGLIIHPDNLQTFPDAINPFYRPDWATTYGPTLAYGDDGDGGVFGGPIVYGSVDDIEENWAGNMMNDTVGFYSGHFFSIDQYTRTYLLLNFFTKHYHYYTRLLYDPNTATNTHGYIDPTTGVFTPVDRTVDTAYNFSLDTCGGDFWNVKFTFLCWNTEEANPPGQFSPGVLVDFVHEAEFLEIGPNHAFKLDTGTFQMGWFRLSNFLVDNDQARAEVVDSLGNGFAGIGSPVTLIYARRGANFIPAIGYIYVEYNDGVSVGQYKWDLTILNSAVAPNAAP